MLLKLSAFVLFDVAGELAARYAHVPLPGPVVGMLLLLAALVAREGLADWLQPGGELLLRHLALFYVPAGVGVVTWFRLLRAEWVPICAALLASTVIALAAGAWTFAWVARRRGAQ